MTESSTNTILLDIFTQMGNIREDIGAIKGQLAVGAERHRDFARSLDKIDVRTEKLETGLEKVTPVVALVTTMAPQVDDLVTFKTATDASLTTIKPQVKDLVEFKGRMAAILLAASAVIGGAFWLIAEGIKYFGTDVRIYLGRLFH